MTHHTDTRLIEPERIYLQPLCCVSPFEGRQWCENNVWPDGDECEESGVEYVRACRIESLRAEVATLREAATLARPIIQNERDVMVECHSCPPDKNATDFDPAIREDIERMDAALEALRTALGDHQ